MLLLPAVVRFVTVKKIKNSLNSCTEDKEIGNREDLYNNLLENDVGCGFV